MSTTKVGKCFIHQSTYCGDGCPICEAANDRQRLIDRALKAEQEVATLQDLRTSLQLEIGRLHDEIVPLRAALEAVDDGAGVAAVYEEWKRDPSSARSYADIRAELVKEGKL